MKVYLAAAKVHSPLIFTSYVSGSTSTGYLLATSPYIHNYALMYAIMDRPAEASFVVSSRHLAGALEYKTIKEVVSSLAEGRAPRYPYTYPMAPVKVNYVTIHTTMLTDQYYFDVRGRPKSVAPRNQNYIAVAPGSTFYTVILSPNPLPWRIYASMGVKRLGIIRIDLCELKVEGRLEEEAMATVLVNEGDTRRFGYNGMYSLVSEARTKPSWNTAASRIAWLTARGLYRARPRDQCRGLAGAIAGGRRGRGAREWLLPLPPRFSYA